MAIPVELQSDATDDEDWNPSLEEAAAANDSGEDVADGFAKDGQIAFDQLEGVELLACDGDGNPLGPVHPDSGLYKVASRFCQRGCDVTEESWKPSDMSIMDAFMKPSESDANNSKGAPYTTLVIRATLDETLPLSAGEIRCATVYELSDQTTQYFYLWPASGEMTMLKGCVEQEATDKELIEAGRRTGKGVAGLPPAARAKLEAWQRPQYAEFTLSPFAYGALTKKLPLKRKPPAKKAAAKPVADKATVKPTVKPVKAVSKPAPKTGAKVTAKPSAKGGLKVSLPKPSNGKRSAALPNPLPPKGPPPVKHAGAEKAPTATPVKSKAAAPQQIPATPKKSSVEAVPVSWPSARRVLNVDAGTGQKRKLPDEFGGPRNTWKVLFDVIQNGERTFQVMEGSGLAPPSVTKAIETLAGSIS